MSSNARTSTITNRSNRRRKIVGGTLGAAAIGLLGFSMLNVSGADFTASDSGTVKLNTGKLSLQLSDATNTGDFDLVFPGLAPGQTKSDSFTITNTGDISASTTFEFKLGDFAGGNVKASDAGELVVSIDGKPAVPAASLIGKPVDLGELAPGAARKVDVAVQLVATAGNEWQGVSAKGVGEVVLTQTD